MPLVPIVRISPGERIALDGVVVAGSASINQAPVTGESMPVDKEPGDAVFAGTINEPGALEIQVTAPAANSTLARIIQAVEQAQASARADPALRGPLRRDLHTGRVRDRRCWWPAWPWLIGWTWLQAVYKALVLLVIACPCALVISTPVTVVSGLAAAARRGILIKGGVYLEGARKLQGDRTRQDRHDHRGKAPTRRVERAGWGDRGDHGWTARSRRALRSPGLTGHCTGTGAARR